MKSNYLLIVLIASVLNMSHAAVFTVNSLANTNTGTGNSGTLLYCINQANLTTGPHTIDFSVAGTISINTSALPALTKEITLDGTTAPGYAGVPVVVIDGTGLTGGSGISVTAANVKIYGLEITGFPYSGIQVNGNTSDFFEIGAMGKGNVVRNNGYYGISISAADNGKIVDNKIGTDATGMTCSMNQYDGIDLGSAANNNSILNNQISCNGYNGIQIGGSNFNVIQGNLIGPLMGSCSGNEYRGIDIESGSTGNKVGGALPSDWNKISGNLYWGIEIKDAGSINNLISGNSFSCNPYSAISVNNGGNNNISAPLIVTANASSISGTAQANAIVEIYKSQETKPSMCSNSSPLNQGTDFLGTATASSTGNWTLTGSFDGYVTAIQRDSVDNTSGFSNSIYTGVPGNLINSCSGESIATALAWWETKSWISVYPNPITDYATIQTHQSLQNASCELLNYHGQKVSETINFEGEKINIQCGNLPAGIYLIRIKEGEKIVGTKKIIVAD